MDELYKVVSGFLPTTASSSMFTIAHTPGILSPTVTTTTTGFPPTPSIFYPTTTTTTRFPPTNITTPSVPLHNNQMLDDTVDWDMYAMGNDFPCHTIVGSSFTTTATTFVPTTITTSKFSPTIVTTPTIPFYNNQRSGDTANWDMYAMGNDFGHHTNVGSSSFATSTTTFIPTPTTFIPTTTTTATTLGIPIHYGQTWDDAINLDLYETDNGFSPCNVATSTSSTNATITTFIPTTSITATTPYIPINNSQTLDGAFDRNMVDDCSSTIFGSSSIFATTTTPTPAASIDVHYQGNSNSQIKRLNVYQPMNEKNIRNLLENSNNSVNFTKRQKTPLSSKNWPILSLPCLGKIPDPSTHKPQHNQLQGKQECLDNSKCSKIYVHTSPKSKKWKKEKRVYKMPRNGLNSEMYSWRYYGEKLVEGSPNPRKYYRCAFKGCWVKRHVETDASDPNMVVMKYSGHHNHLMPMFMDNSVGRTSRHPTNSNLGARLDNHNLMSSCSRTVVSPASTDHVLAKKKENTDSIFDGLANIIDL